MKVQLHTDTHVIVDAELAARIEAKVEGELVRFAGRLSHVEVHLTDESGGRRSGAPEIRCVIGAGVVGQLTVTVTEDAASVAEALDGAVEKLIASLEHRFGRLEDRGYRETIRGH